MDVNTPIPLGPSNKDYLEDRGVVVGKDNAIPYGHLLVLQTIATMRQLEAQEATNVKLNELIRLGKEARPGTP